MNSKNKETYCTKENPDETAKWHQDAKVVSTDTSYGYDEKYRCPYCSLSWWEELDG